jgi:hypothetical protein
VPYKGVVALFVASPTSSRDDVTAVALRCVDGA